MINIFALTIKHLYIIYYHVFLVFFLRLFCSLEIAPDPILFFVGF